MKVKTALLTLSVAMAFSVLAASDNGDKKYERLPSPFEVDQPKGPSEATNLGPGVNSPYSDFGPIITPDGNQLYFTSDRPGGKGGQDVWFCKRVNGQWEEAENLGAPINTPGNEGPDSFSISENALYFTACDREFGKGGCDIYVSYRLEDKWSIPENLGGPVNTEHNESNASISSDGSFLIFTSDRPGGKGGNDLWMAERGEMIQKLMPGFSTKGRWKEPENLGPGVNTPEWEGVGFLMPDNATLYFSSRGHGGKGLADIFRSVYKGEEWSEAQNMGDIINTSRDDIYFTLPGSGDLAYFSSDSSGGLGKEDLYSIPIPLIIPECKLVVLRGRVADAESGKPIKASISVKDPDTGETLARSESAADNGSFHIAVETSRLTLEVSGEGHETYEETMEIEENKNCALVMREINLDSR